MTPMNDNQLPDTLIQLLEFIATEYLPEITAHVTFANQWLDDQPDLSAGTNGLDDPAQRFIGMAEFEWRDRKLTTVVMPYRFLPVTGLTVALRRSQPRGATKRLKGCISAPDWPPC